MLGLIFIIWMLYSLTEGYREAYYWHYRSFVVDKLKFNIHIIFTIQRGIVLSLITLLVMMVCDLNIVKTIFYISACGLVFSFLHNGMYYTIRHKLNNLIYVKKWFDQSTTSTASSDKINFFNPISRTLMFVVGIAKVIILMFI